MGIDRRHKARGQKQRLLLLLICAVLLISLDYHRRANGIHWVLSSLFSPIQRMVSVPVEYVHTIQKALHESQDILHENARYRAKQLLLQFKLHKMLALERENAELHALLESKPRLNGKKVLVASLLRVGLVPYAQELVIDRGRDAEIYVGQPVLDAYGILGQVISVAKDSSRVLLLSDPRHAIPIEDDRTGVRAIAVGAGMQGRLRLLYVQQTADIKIGDLLVTSGLGQVFPAGYPVGTVATLHHVPGEAFTQVWVAPKAHMGRAQQVLLLWPNIVE